MINNFKIPQKNDGICVSVENPEQFSFLSYLSVHFWIRVNYVVFVNTSEKSCEWNTFWKIWFIRFHIEVVFVRYAARGGPKIASYFAPWKNVGYFAMLKSHPLTRWYANGGLSGRSTGLCRVYRFGFYHVSIVRIRHGRWVYFRWWNFVRNECKSEGAFGLVVFVSFTTFEFIGQASRETKWFVSFLSGSSLGKKFKLPAKCDISALGFSHEWH